MLDWTSYVDPAALDAERARMFDNAWQYLGHRDSFTGVNAVTPCDVGRIPAIVTCDASGELRAFANVCRHRGSILVRERTCRASVQCPYHAWTYALDGRLLAAPRASDAPGFDADALGLRELALAWWGPFAFAAHAPPDSLEAWLGALPELVRDAGVNVEELRFVTRAEGEVAANWKVVCENYLECYHCQVAHPGFSALVDVSANHYELEESEALFTQRAHVRARAGAAAARSATYDADGPIRSGQFHYRFPNLVVNIAPGQANLSLGPVLPAGPARTRRYLDYFVGGDVPDAWVQDLLAWDDRVGEEDVRLVEAVQEGLASGVFDGGVLVDEERLVARFRQLVASGLAGTS